MTNLGLATYWGNLIVAWPKKTWASNVSEPTEKPGPGNQVENKPYGLEISKKVTPKIILVSVST